VPRVPRVPKVPRVGFYRVSRVLARSAIEPGTLENQTLGTFGTFGTLGTLGTFAPLEVVRICHFALSKSRRFLITGLRPHLDSFGNL
jgi:hypothetical protein